MTKQKELKDALYAWAEEDKSRRAVFCVAVEEIGEDGEEGIYTTDACINGKGYMAAEGLAQYMLAEKYAASVVLEAVRRYANGKAEKQGAN